MGARVQFAHSGATRLKALTLPPLRRRRRSSGLRGVIALFAALSATVQATPVTVELPLPYRLIEDELVRQVYLGDKHTAEVLGGKNACNALTLSEPHVSGAPGRIIIRTKVKSKSGTPLTGGRCFKLFTWTGQLEITEEAYAEGLAIKFRVVDSTIRAADGQHTALPGVLWGWIKENVHPRLQSVSIDLRALRAATQSTLAVALPNARDSIEAIAGSFRIQQLSSDARALNLTLALDAPAIPPNWQAPPPQPPLTIEELDQWRAAWQNWEGYATWLIKILAHDRSAAFQQALATVLLDGRHDLVTALASDAEADPVPALFLKLWPRLVPVVNQLTQTMPGGDALRYLGFISALDGLRSVNSVAPQLGLRLDRDGLRQLARLLVPALDEAALNYSTDIDPELRRLMGFDAEFPLSSIAPSVPWWVQLIPAADAGPTLDPALSQRLVGWAPQRSDLDAYLREVARLFDQVEQAEHARGHITARFLPVYDTLLRATAWEETCWRQFILKSGQIEPIRSPSGSVGIMQVNTHVWRGLYEVNGLLKDAGYNARAGNEILVHYLVDYAIKQKEHDKGGSLDSLARATYAIYNGGPGHIARYRKPSTGAALRKIDAAFWEKYLALKRGGPEAVKQCYLE